MKKTLTDKDLVLLDRDVEQLQRLLNDRVMENHQYCRVLRQEIGRARTVTGPNLPRSVVTMHSTVEVLDLDENEKMTYTLVFPWETDADNGKISILTPIGTALLGYRAGDSIGWSVPGGTARFKILEVQQPAYEQ